MNGMAVILSRGLDSGRIVRRLRYSRRHNPNQLDI